MTDEGRAGVRGWLGAGIRGAAGGLGQWVAGAGVECWEGQLGKGRVVRDGVGWRLVGC